jgi:hypothetical protein
MVVRCAVCQDGRHLPTDAGYERFDLSPFQIVWLRRRSCRCADCQSGCDWGDVRVQSIFPKEGAVELPTTPLFILLDDTVETLSLTLMERVLEGLRRL